MENALVVVSPRNEFHGDQHLQSLASVDRTFAQRVVAVPSLEHTRLVLSPCGELSNDTDDVRKVRDAAAVGALAALAMGASRLSLRVDQSIPKLQHPVDGDAFAQAVLVAQLAVWQATYVPLNACSTSPSVKRRKLTYLAVEGASSDVARLASAIEAGRELARDLGAGDPEYMSPPRFAEHVRATCELAGIFMEVIDNISTLQKEYPLLMAAARATIPVERHRPSVVRLCWQGEGAIERTVCIAGKGVAYDTGGADIKTGGSMAGLRRDQCGAAAAAGFILACAKAPAATTKGLKVLVELGCVRNSIGSDAYVADEVLLSHAGKRVLVGNTEGRLVLADCLSHLRTQVLKHSHPCPTFLSLATLTGHALLSYGPFAVAIDSGAARAVGGVAPHLAAAGFALGEPVEVGSLRREDYEHIMPGTSGTPVSKCPETYDVLQTNTAKSTNTMRGHQFPMAFLMVASGLQDHGAGTQNPLPYCHMDLAGSVADGRGIETGSPLLALFGHFVMRLSRTSRF